jgi:hypothetical protein
MDIGKQQRVIVVEPEKLEVPVMEPAAAPGADRSIHDGALPEDLPLPMDVAPVLTADV